MLRTFKICFWLSIAVVTISLWALVIYREEFFCMPILIGGAMAVTFGFLIANEK